MLVKNGIVLASETGLTVQLHRQGCADFAKHIQEMLRLSSYMIREKRRDDGDDLAFQEQLMGGAFEIPDPDGLPDYLLGESSNDGKPVRVGLQH